MTLWKHPSLKLILQASTGAAIDWRPARVNTFAVRVQIERLLRKDEK